MDREDSTSLESTPSDTGEVAQTSEQTEQGTDSEVQPEATDATDGGNVSRVFTQQDVDRIVESRLKRQQRSYERKLRELQEKVEGITQRGQGTSTPASDPSILNRQFLAEFARDPMGTLRKFANSVMAEQNQNLMQTQRKTQVAAMEALENLKEKYPDFDRYSQEIIQYVQRSPSLSLALRSAGQDITPELYEDVLEQGYQAVRRKAITQAQAVGNVQLNSEQQTERDEKARAGTPRRKPGTSTSAKTAEDVIFEAMMKLGGSGRRR